MGVPQGSVLGPLLFLIYINDIHNALYYSSCILYADDSTIFYSHNNCNILIDRLTIDLNLINNWLISNKLLLNKDKCSYIIFSNKRKPQLNNLVLEDWIVNRVDHHNFLGVILDSKLNFKMHIQGVCSKVSKTVGILYKLKDILPLRPLKDLYNTLVLPYLNYCVTAWGAASFSAINTIYLLQKKLIRIISNEDYLAHTRSLFLNNNILTIMDLYKFSCLKLTYQILNINSDNFAYFRGIVDVHQANTRYPTRNDQMRIPFTSTTLSRQSIIFCGLKQWNSLPANLKSIESYPLFKTKLKKYFVELYNS